jgi:hypothetical protein
VKAGLTLEWSNGPVEGYVNRLKLMKRSMYGRAKLPLLRTRVLHVEEPGAFSRGSPRRIMRRLLSCGEQVQEVEAGVGAERADVGC